MFLRLSRSVIRKNVPLLALSAFLAAAPVPKVSISEQDQEQRYLEDLKYLAAPEMEGRGAGTAGLERASDYIAAQFKRLALQPVGDKGAYKQDFFVTTDPKLGPNNSLRIDSQTLRLNQDFRPISFSSNAQISSDKVVFAGYGITSRKHSYDDYAGIDVRNKVVIVERFEPPRFSHLEAGKPPVYSTNAYLVNKAINARNHGAAAMILINGEGEKDELLEFGKTAGPDDAGLPIIHIKRNFIAVLKSSPRVNLRVEIERPQTRVHNVLGYLPGKSSQYIVIGAHYDHVGYGYQNSLAPETAGRVHPGADDNASGTAGLLTLARIFAQQRSGLDKGILFAAFAGEELGLLGSENWVNHPTLPLQNAVAMINLDMIGRANGGKLFIGGVKTGSTFEELVKDAIAKYEFKVEYSFKDSTASDHASFLGKRIPSLFFFSGLHGDYHRPTDTWDKIDTHDASKIVDAVADVTSGLASAGERPTFVKARTNAGRRGRGPYLGITPDFIPGDKGVRVVEVASESPAEKAGLQEGDLIVSLGGAPMFNLYDLTYALHDHEARDVVEIRLLRGSTAVTTTATLEKR